MKFITPFLVLAVFASQAMAATPVPIKQCTKTVVVRPTDSTCNQFAKDNNITFKQMLAWNNKLRKDCMNLIIGAPVCVSIKPKAPKPKAPKPKEPVCTETKAKKPVAKKPKAKKPVAKKPKAKKPKTTKPREYTDSECY